VFAHWRISNKLKLGIGLMTVSLLALFASGIYGLYAYRGLVKSLSARSTELPLANELKDHVADLRETLSRARERLNYLPLDSAVVSAQSDQAFVQQVEESFGQTDTPLMILREQYLHDFQWFRATLVEYKKQLKANRQRTGTRIGDDQEEQKTLIKIDKIVDRIDDGELDEAFEHYQMGSDPRLVQLEEEINNLYLLTAELPSHLHNRLILLLSEVRTKYRIAIPVAWTMLVLSISMAVASALLFRVWIAQPLKTLVEGSRIVAREKRFDHRIHLETHDEIQELAEAMNEMTARFQEIHESLDRQVQQQTRQVVRSEQLASVGFLAAGVAHEINNPLASIALCSESLEGRLAEVMAKLDESLAPERDVILHYLEMIQKEAFRCKQITEKLLDFSRMGDSEKHNTDMLELVSGVIEIAKLSRYKDKDVILLEGEPVIAEVNPQEIKQVVLNLITNALDSIEPGGTVQVSVAIRGGDAEIVVVDDGCGMTDEVIRHLFEPFFTRRRGGQGTGLGLSITFRIVEEHHGQIHATSDGVGNGSQFIVTLPLQQPVGNQKRKALAA
jgi:signal transduction histidine kinase